MDIITTIFLILTGASAIVYIVGRKDTEFIIMLLFSVLAYLNEIFIALN